MDQPEMHSPEPQPDLRSEQERQNRRILTGFTALLVLGLLTAALWPTAAKRPESGEAVVPVPTPVQISEPAQPAPTVAPPEQPTAAEPEPVKAVEPLPDLPAGEPSLLVAHGDRGCPQIALTFDAGSGADGAAAVLDMLKTHKVTSTFFLTGKWVERYQDLARRIAAEGHEIANHTYSHPDLTKLPPAEVLEQVTRGEEAIQRITGKATRPLFREPYGAINETGRRLVRQAGYSYSVFWDVDTLDWQFPPVETLVNRITQKSRNGSIVLMHLNVPDTAKAIDVAIPRLREQGYRLVTVTQVIKCPAQ